MTEGQGQRSTRAPVKRDRRAMAGQCVAGNRNQGSQVTGAGTVAWDSFGGVECVGSAAVQGPGVDKEPKTEVTGSIVAH